MSRLYKTLILILLVLTAAGNRATLAEEIGDPALEVLTAATGLAKGTLNPAKHGVILRPNAKVMVIPINDTDSTKYGMIDDWQAHFVERRLRRAADEKFDLVILEINTYGGSVDSCRKINEAIAACPVPVIAFVKDMAFSGGALISLGSQMIVMTPSSQIGGAKVVMLTGDLPEGQRQKQDAMIRAMVSSLCEVNRLKSPDGKAGYPEPIAVGMVNSDAEIVETNDPFHRFMTDDELSTLKVKPAIVKKWKSKGSILSLAANEAVNVGIASGIVRDFDELYLGLGIQLAYIDIAEVTASERIARFLSNPIWSVVLVLIGLVGLVWEMKSPGHGIGYITFAFCLGLFFWLQVFADNAGLMEILLFGLGAGVIAVELFVLPTFGAGLFVGLTLVLASLILAFIPESVNIWKVLQGRGSSSDAQLMKDGLFWATLTVFIVVGVAIVGFVKGAKLPGLSRLALNAEVRSTVTAYGDGSLVLSVPESERALDADSLIGKSAEAETVLKPAGKVRLDGVTYEAVSEGSFIDAGTKVVVMRIAAGSLVVRVV